MSKRNIFLIPDYLFLSVLFITILIIGCSTGSDRSSERVVSVDRGKVTSLVQTMGVVEAENEAIILSPWATLVQQVLKQPGTLVRKGEVILVLDSEPIKKDIEDIKDQLEIKKNNLEKTRLNNKSSIIDQDYNTEVKQLKITSLKSQLADEEQLLSVGGISPARIEETKQNIVLAERDLEMTKVKNGIRLKQLRADEEGLLLQIRIQEKQLAQKVGLLDQMEVKAPSDGILLSVSAKVGEKTSTDKVLVRLSDLSSFKIVGSADEKLSEFIKVGCDVSINTENGKLSGTVESISPVVENKKIQFYVKLEGGSNQKLIANQAVNMDIMQSSKDNVLRISGSDVFFANREQVVEIKDSGKVVKKNVRFGIKGTEFIEVISGLQEGDQVILPASRPRKSSNISDSKS